MDWSERTRFSLYEAGFLKCGLNPLPPLFNSPSDQLFYSLRLKDDPKQAERYAAETATGELIMAVKNRKLRIENIDGNIHDSEALDIEYFASNKWFIQRDDFLSWASEKGINLRILSSKVNNQKPKKESQTQTDNLKMALVCMAIDGYGYDPEDKKSSIPKHLSDVFSRRGFEISDKTIRNWLNEGKNLLNPIKT